MYLTAYFQTSFDDMKTIHDKLPIKLEAVLLNPICTVTDCEWDCDEPGRSSVSTSRAGSSMWEGRGPLEREAPI